MQKQGFSLVEILIAMVVFLIVIVGAFNVFLNGFRQQKNVLDLIETLNNTSYASEYMTRALRMGQKDISGDCTGTAKNNFGNPGGASSAVNFINHWGKCQQFALELGEIVVKKSDDETDSFSVAVPLTLSSFNVINLRFEIAGDGQSNTQQPKVTFNLQAQKPNSKFGNISFQTTVSQRQLDISY